MTTSNRLSKVAIVGAGGNVGRFMTDALLKTGKHTVTAITRLDSQNTLPAGVVVKRVDYDKPETLVEALHGQEALIITISARSGLSRLGEIQETLIKAAGDAGVPWVLPNEWSPDSANEDIVNDVLLFKSKVAARKLIESIGVSSYVSVVTGCWYEWSLGIARNYGFDFTNRTVKFFDDGDTKISTSSWPQVGLAVAALLSLPVEPEGRDREACLESLRNKVVYINSFTVSQRDMLASVLRVTNTKEDDWTITKKDVREQYSTGMQEMKEGNFQGSANFLYSRTFFPDGCGNFEHNKGTINSLLGLPKEDIDEATKVAIERQKATGGY